MSSKIYVYALVDPRSPEQIRYVGHAIDVDGRRKRHINDASTQSRTHKVCWIRKLLSDGVEPDAVKKVVVASRNEAAHYETLLISAYKSSGHRLTNSTAGGDGVVEWTPELRARVRMLKLGKKRGPHTDATKRKMSAAHKGRIRSPQEIEANKKVGIARRGKPISETARASFVAMGERNRGKKRPADVVAKYVAKLRSPEVRAKLSAASKLRWQLGLGITEEGRKRLSESAKRLWSERGHTRARNERGQWT